MSSRKLLSPLLIGALLLAAVVVYLNLPAEEQVKKSGPLPTTVKTILVEQGAMAITIEALGTARANESIAVTAQVTETVS
jgi:membrane fusion protein (multidrug efflux system)